MGDLQVGSLWVSVKLAIGLQYLESSIFSVASGYRLATSQGKSAIARRKYTDKKLQYLVCEGGN
ncbi:hypothetical protein CF108_04550 [Aeromonas veronii]|nr:hypothetical protein CF108_04550 [Aeromonas veronii]